MRRHDWLSTPTRIAWRAKRTSAWEARGTTESHKLFPFFEYSDCYKHLELTQFWNRFDKEPFYPSAVVLIRDSSGYVHISTLFGTHKIVARVWNGILSFPQKQTVISRGNCMTFIYVLNHTSMQWKMQKGTEPTRFLGLTAIRDFVWFGTSSLLTNFLGAMFH